MPANNEKATEHFCIGDVLSYLISGKYLWDKDAECAIKLKIKDAGTFSKLKTSKMNFTEKCMEKDGCVTDLRFIIKELSDNIAERVCESIESTNTIAWRDKNAYRVSEYSVPILEKFRSLMQDDLDVRGEPDIRNLVSRINNFLDVSRETEDDFIKLLSSIIERAIIAKNNTRNRQKQSARQEANQVVRAASGDGEQTEVGQPIPFLNVVQQKNTVILKSTKIHAKPVFVQGSRDEIFKKIDQAFISGDNAVFLTGMGGIGKTETAKHYAAERFGENKEYKTIVFAQSDNTRGTDNILSLINDDSVFIIKNFPTKSDYRVLFGVNETDIEYFTRKLAKIKELSDEHTLFVIDGFDVDEDYNLKIFLEGDYHILITTRHRFPGLDCPVIDVDAITEEHLIEMFFLISGRYDVPPDDRELHRIIEMLGYHTFAVEIISKLMKETQMTTGEILSVLMSQDGLSSVDARLQVSAFERSKRPYDYLKALINISYLEGSDLAEEFKYILANMTIMPFSGVKKTDFITWSGLGNATAINRLIEWSWLSEEFRGTESRISVHPLTCEIAAKEYNADYSMCAKTIDSVCAIADEAFYMTRDEQEYYKPIFLRIIDRLPVINSDHYREYMSLAHAFFTLEEFDISRDILRKLEICINENGGEGSDQLAEVYTTLQEHYMNLFRYEEAIRFGEKAFNIYSHDDCNEFLISENTRLLFWCYIRLYISNHEKENALEFLDTAENYLKRYELLNTKYGEKDSRYTGKLLFAKARLFYEKGDHIAALDHVMQSLSFFEKTEGDTGMDCGSAHYMIGLCIAETEGDYIKSIEHLQKCRDIWTLYKSQTSLNFIDIDTFMGDVLYKAGKYDEALNKYQSAHSALSTVYDEMVFKTNTFLWNKLSSLEEKISQTTAKMRG